MTNIRKIIEERLENAKNEYHCYVSGNGNVHSEYYELQGQIEAYQDCLNLMQPRTEQEILKDFEALGWLVCCNDNEYIILELDCRTLQCKHSFERIYINIQDEYYIKSLSFETIEKDYIQRQAPITMQEHKLLNELFEVIFDDK